MRFIFILMLVVSCSHIEELDGNRFKVKIKKSGKHHEAIVTRINDQFEGVLKNSTAKEKEEKFKHIAHAEIIQFCDERSYLEKGTYFYLDDKFTANIGGPMFVADVMQENPDYPKKLVWYFECQK